MTPAMFNPPAGVLLDLQHKIPTNQQGFFDPIYRSSFASVKTEHSWDQFESYPPDVIIIFGIVLDHIILF